VLLVSLASALLGWFEPAASVLHAIGAFGPAAFVAAVEAMAHLPGAEVAVRAPLPAGIAWYGVLGALVWALGRREASSLDQPARAWSASTALLGVTAAGLWFIVLTPAEPFASITVLDVGQGEAILLRDGGASVLVDVGPPDGAAVRALSRVDAGRDIDAIVVTHTDLDHAGGLENVLRRYEVGDVLAGDTALPGRRIDIGDRIRISDRMWLEVLSPPVATARGFHATDNNGSLVLMVTVGDRRVLLTADIEADAEGWLVESGIDLHADALVVPHHGSLTSSTAAFIDAVAPSIAVISVGGNPYGHPHPEVLERYVGIELVRTDEDGDVTLATDGERLWLRTGR
jgi:competence protein ComEC